jgi:hypothetical protein
MGDVSTLPTRVEHGAELLALADRRLAAVLDGPPTTLDDVLRRLFDRDELLTYSAFGSAL